ncbi:TPA: hypothetical protein ACVOZG_004641 [Vibrio diabolicus]|uniref:hypothetical protein n=1 Tax=Vibrio diabolicus TaxID=50719 RepID=UPI002160C01E|nr:hypothetical protein [Vibrio diabolicus]MCS0363255.1 hypothetical protein [Vibrio diabolicus]
MSPRLIGIQNGSIVFIFWLGVGLFLVFDWHLAIPVFVAYLLPISLIVAWRSEKLVIDLSKKLATIRTYALEGFWVGFSVCIVFWFWNLANQALAAGNVLDGASSSDIIKYVLFFSLPVSVLVGLLGAIQGMLFFHLNSRQLAS